MLFITFSNVTGRGARSKCKTNGTNDRRAIPGSKYNYHALAQAEATLQAPETFGGDY